MVYLYGYVYLNGGDFIVFKRCMINLFTFSHWSSRSQTNIPPPAENIVLKSPEPQDIYLNGVSSVKCFTAQSSRQTNSYEFGKWIYFSRI